MAMQGKARRDYARQGVAQKGKAGLVKARCGDAREAVARQGKLGYARQGKAWFCKGRRD
jgi:hypothetical protein